VRNGSISGFDDAVFLDGSAIVEGLRVFGPEGMLGISVTLGIVRNNSVIGFDTAISVGGGSTVIGNNVFGLGNANIGMTVTCPSNVTDNTSTGNHFNLVLNGTGCNNTNNVAP
jgi:hypothetical protein